MSLFSEHLASYKRTVVPADYLMEKILAGRRFIDNHYAGSITLADISAASLISRFHFIRLFKKCYGRTPNQYLIDLRIARAKTLLKSGMNASEVCLAVGFLSPTSFTCLFKKITGITPARYARDHKLKKAIFEKKI